MGQCTSIEADDLSELLILTSFKEDDLKRWYTRFIQDYPEGYLNEDEFHDIYSTIYNTSFCNHFAKHIFRSFDKDNDGVLSFKELMVAMSVASHGTSREKLELAFNVYDINGTGRVTLDDVRHVIVCIQNNLRRRTSSFVSLKVNDKEVREMFEAVDVHSRGYWTVDEFIEGMDVNPAFVRMLYTAPTSNRQKQMNKRKK